MSRDLGLSLGLVVATLAVYSGVVSNGFVSYDDPLYILKNPHVSSGLSTPNIAWAFSAIHSDNWHPLTWLSHMLDCQLFGLDAGRHHAVSAIFHALNAVLLFWFFRRATSDRWASFFVAAFFALHPLRVESVAWASERKDLLSTLFFLVTLLAYARYAGAPSLARFSLVVLAFGLGLLAKPMLVTLPLILILLDYWPLKRMSGRLPSRDLIFEKLPLFVMAAASGAITLYAQSGKHTMQSFETIPLLDRIANAMVSCITYLAQSVWPVNLAFFYPHPSIVDAGWPLSLYAAGAVSAVLLAGISAIVLRLAKSHPHLFVGWLWYGIALVPVIGIVQVGGQAHADRYTYLPMMGIAVALCFEARARIGAYGRVAAAVAAAALLSLGLSTRNQVAVWRDSFSLYQHAQKTTVNNYIAAHNLGADLSQEGTYRQAIRHYLHAIAIRPDYAASRSNLGIALERTGQLEAAAASYRTALSLEPDLAQAHVNLGSLLLAQGDPVAALDHYAHAAALRPESVDILSHNAELHHRMGRHDEAVVLYQRALALAPDSQELHTRIADVYLATNLHGHARTHLEAALARDPRLLPAANRLAWILSTSTDAEMRDGSEALRLARICTNATRNMNPRFLQTLAAAHAELGEFEQAAAWQRRAADLTPLAARKPVENQIARYQSGEALRISASATP